MNIDKECKELKMLAADLLFMIYTTDRANDNLKIDTIDTVKRAIRIFMDTIRFIKRSNNPNSLILLDRLFNNFNDRLNNMWNEFIKQVEGV